jgi:hypothetical protein
MRTPCRPPGEASRSAGATPTLPSPDGRRPVTNNFEVSNKAWKLFISALSVLGGAYLLAIAAYALGPLSSREIYGMGMQALPSIYTGSHTFTITGLSPGSPLLGVGARVGDTVRYDEHGAGKGRLGPDDMVGLTLYQVGNARHVVLKPVATAQATGKIWEWLCMLTLGLLSLCFGLVVAYKRPGERAYRFLALSFALNVFNCNFYAAPLGSARSVFIFVWNVTLPMWGYAVFMFAIYLAGTPTSGMRAFLHRSRLLLHVLMVCLLAQLAWFASGHDVPFLNPIQVASNTLMTLGLIAALWDGRRHARGDKREQQNWILACFGAMSVASVLSDIYIAGDIAGWRIQLMVTYLVTLLSFAGLMYAVLKHKVFDFGFVVNRALLFTVATLILLALFGIVERLVDHVIHFEGRRANGVLDGAIALGVYLGFHRIKHGVDHWLERLFFHRWHSNEARLREFVRDAAHITAADVLLRDFQHELRRFTGGANCGIYLRQSNGDYAATHDNDHIVDDAIDANDRLCVKLRAAPAAMLVDNEHPHHAGVLACPMRQRGELLGFVLLPPKPNGAPYRPDEIEALGWASEAVGLDINALLVEHLNGELRANASKILELRSVIEHLQTMLAGAGGMVPAKYGELGVAATNQAK